MKFCSIKLEQSSIEQIQPIEVLVLKFGSISSLMCFSALNLRSKHLKKYGIDRDNVKYCLHLRCFKTTNYMALIPSHSNRQSMVLIIPDHPHHHHHPHHLYLYLYFVCHLFLHLPLQHIHYHYVQWLYCCHLLCLEELFYCQTI